MPVVHYLHPVTSLDQDITDTEGLSGQWFSFNPHPTLHAPLERMSALIPLNHVFKDISAVAHGSLFQAKVLDDAIEAIVGGHNNRALQMKHSPTSHHLLNCNKWVILLPWHVSPDLLYLVYVEIVLDVSHLLWRSQHITIMKQLCW